MATEIQEPKELIPEYEYITKDKMIKQKLIIERTTVTGIKVDVIEAEGEVDYNLIKMIKSQLQAKITAYQEHLQRIASLETKLPTDIKGE